MSGQPDVATGEANDVACTACVGAADVDPTATLTVAGLIVTAPTLKHGAFDVCDSSGNCGSGLPADGLATVSKGLLSNQFFDAVASHGVINAWSVKIQTLSSKKVQATGNLLLAGSLAFADGTTMSSVSDAMPSGAVLAFDLASCPPGWSAFGPAAGRTIVGLPSGGTLQGTVRSALGRRPSRARRTADTATA